jgi:hypothetical protein
VTDRDLAHWVARDIETHLEELVATTRQWRDGKADRPVVTVYLASGARHTGHVLDQVRSTLVVQSVPQRGTADLDVTMISLARIEALAVHGAQDLVSDVPAHVPAAAATSMLDLRRRARGLADLVATRIGHALVIELGSGELVQLAPLFEATRVALDRVCADDLGRTALSERVQQIELRIGTPGVSLASATLVVSGPLTLDRLQKELDAAL